MWGPDRYPSKFDTWQIIAWMFVLSYKRDKHAYIYQFQNWSSSEGFTIVQRTTYAQNISEHGNRSLLTFLSNTWQISQLKKEILLMSQPWRKQTVYPSGSFQNDREWCCDHMSSLWHAFYLKWRNITAETLILIKCIKACSFRHFHLIILLYCV